MPPQILMVTFEDRRQVHRKKRVSRHVEGDIQVLRIVQMKRFADEWRVNSDRQENEYREIASHLFYRRADPSPEEGILKYSRTVSPFGRRYDETGLKISWRPMIN